jgi:hypothetical protein
MGFCNDNSLSNDLYHAHLLKRVFAGRHVYVFGSVPEQLYYLHVCDAGKIIVMLTNMWCTTHHYLSLFGQMWAGFGAHLAESIPGLILHLGEPHLRLNRLLFHFCEQILKRRGGEGQ